MVEEIPYAYVLFDKHGYFGEISQTVEGLFKNGFDLSGTKFTGYVVVYYPSGKSEEIELSNSQLRKINAIRTDKFKV